MLMKDIGKLPFVSAIMRIVSGISKTFYIKTFCELYEKVDDKHRNEVSTFSSLKLIQREK